MQVSNYKAESPCPLMHSCAYRHTHWYNYKLDVYKRCAVQKFYPQVRWTVVRA
jgi:hypothetical protein